MTETSPWMLTYRGMVHPWNCDQFGHMNVRWYAHHFDDAAFQIWSCLGFLPRQMVELGFHTVIANTRTNFVKELLAGDLFSIESGFIRCGNRSCTYKQRLLHAETGEVHATQTGVEVFFDPETRAARDMPDRMRKLIEEHLVAEDD